MSKTITRKYIQRITKREGNTSIRQSSGGGGGGGGGASQYWVEENYISKLFFNQLFTVYDEDGNVVEPNDTESVIASIKSMFGFWTDAYLSALGNGEGGGAELTLASLADVDVHGVANGQALVYDAYTQKWVPGQAGLDPTSLWQELGSLGTEQISSTHLTTALSTYNPTNNFKTINGYSIIGTGDINVGGGGGSYLPLSGGTLTGSLQIYSTASGGGWDEGVRMHVASDLWCGVVMCGSDNTGSSGTSAKTWSIHNNDGRLYIVKNGSSSYTHGLDWTNGGELTVKATRTVIAANNDNPSAFDNINSSGANNWMYFRVKGINKAAAGYYSNFAFISNEYGDAPRIGVADDGTPQYWPTYNGNIKYTLIHSGNISTQSVYSAGKLTTARLLWGNSFDGSADTSGSLHIYSTAASGGWNEGIRMHVASNGWCGVTMCGSDNTGAGGTSAKTWSIHNNDGIFYINKNGSNAHTGYEICNVNGNWGISTVSPSYKLHVVGVAYASTGFYSGGYVTALSDARHKDVKGDVGLTVSEVANAPSVKFLWKDRRQEGLQVGSIAQYWQKVMPEAIVKNADGELTMSYGVIALLASIATARKVEDHERRIRELEEENKKLKKQLNAA